jgi:hypothetical protein
MKHKRWFIILAILALVTSSLACGLVNGGDETSIEAAPIDQPVESTSSDNLLEEAPADEEPADQLPVEESEDPAPPPSVDMDNEYRSEEGGYAFLPIPGYELEEFLGLASMAAPDANPDLGPMLLLIGGINEEEATTEEIFDKFIQEVRDEEIEILDQKEISVDGQSGILAEISGKVDEQEVIGRIVVVAVTPTQQFTLFASAPQDKWDEVEPLFDAVLASINFFEPQEIDLSEAIIDEAEEDESEETGESEEVVNPPIDEAVEFPTTYSELPSGGFAYLLASSEGGLPTIVTQGTTQDQSTSAEYVIGLVNENEGNTVTLFIPLNVSSGILVMNPYDEGSAIKGPGAAVYMDLGLYTNTDGMIIVEAMKDNTISGTFTFVAEDEDGNEIVVSGFFNELPLGP